MIIRDFGVRQDPQSVPAPTASDANPALEGAIEAISNKARPPALFTQAAKAWTRKRKNIPDTIKEDWERTVHYRNTIGKLGAKVERTYSPFDVFNNPPGPKDVTLELLMASQAHMGHHASIWNPANARYIFGIRQGIHIISLEQTAAHLRRAARVVEEVAYYGGLILFVGTRPGQTPIVTQAARLAKGCHLFTKWTPGTITNSDKILPGIPIQIVDELDQPLEGYNQHLAERRALVPDLVVCLNPKENFTLLHECGQHNVPTIGVIDTDVEPSWVTYAIPANDDSLRCLAVIGSVLGRAGQAGQERRLEDAKKGKVSWQTPLEIQQWMNISRKREAWAKRLAEEKEAEERGGKAKSNAAEEMWTSKKDSKEENAEDEDEDVMTILKRIGAVEDPELIQLANEYAAAAGGGPISGAATGGDATNEGATGGKTTIGGATGGGPKE